MTNPTPKTTKPEEGKKITHKWWHFIYGRSTIWELVSESKKHRTSNCYDICKKCGKQLTEKEGLTTFTIGTFTFKTLK